MLGVWSRVAGSAVVMGLVALAGCKPEVGGKCSQNGIMAKTGDATSVLTCVSGAWTKLPCRGPKGAAQVGARMECDDTIASDGDACLQESNADAACSVDRKSFLICNATATGATFSTKAQCRGPKQCQVTGNEVTCDTTLQSVNDPCDQPGVGTCSEDKKRRLVCKDSKWQVDRFCRGASGCTTSNREVDCDESLANPGDPCGLSGNACSNDGKTELSCVGGHFVPHKTCKNWCRIVGSRTLDCV
jgi:hypothetical protein